MIEDDYDVSWWARVRRVGHGAAADREGLPGGWSSRPAAGSPTTSCRAETSWRASAGSCGRRGSGCYGIQRIHLLPRRRGPGRRRRRRRVAGLRQHPVRAARGSSSTTRSGGTSPTGDELAPYYDQAARMLGVVTNPTITARRRGDEAGRRRDGRRPHLPAHAGRGVLRPRRTHGAGDAVADPYFGGAGPARTGCIECGACMTGCRHNAKNTLAKNYLDLAEQAGAVVHPLTTVVRGAAARAGGGYAVDTVRTGAWRRRRAGARSPPSRWWSRPARAAPSSCCTG